MNRRKSLKILGGTAVGIAGLVLADWKWQLLDGINHKGFFTLKEEKLISAIADTIIPEGLPPKIPSPEAKPIGALSTGTDIYMMKLSKTELMLISGQISGLAIFIMERKSRMKLHWILQTFCLQNLRI